MYLSQINNHKKDYDLKSNDPELNTNIENEFLMKEIHVAIDKLPEKIKSKPIFIDIFLIFLNLKNRISIVN